jgi:hypothetical protein
MPGRDPGPSVKDKKLYEELRDEGNSKEKSARIANASAARGRGKVAATGGHSGSYASARRRSGSPAGRRCPRASSSTH